MMKRTLFGLFAGLVVAGTLVAAQNAQAPAQQPPSSPPSPSAPAPREPASPAPQMPSPSSAATQKPGDVSFTGCLVQGSGPTVFILENAKGTGAAARTQSFVLDTASGSKVDFKADLNHQVTIIGTADNKMAPTAPAGEKVAEKDMAKLTARSLVKLADTCPAG